MRPDRADQFEDGRRGLAAVIADPCPAGGIGVVRAVLDGGRCAPVEQMTHHLDAAELHGEMQRGGVAVGAGIDVHPGIEEVSTTSRRSLSAANTTASPTISDGSPVGAAPAGRPTSAQFGRYGYKS